MVWPTSRTPAPVPTTAPTSTCAHTAAHPREPVELLAHAPGRQPVLRGDPAGHRVQQRAQDDARDQPAVAAAAGVGRTTLHRHFPDRDALVAAVDRESWERFNAATNRAAIDRDTGAQALDRLLREVVALGPVLGLVFADNALVEPETWETDARPDPFGVVVVRGQQDGSLAADLPAAWIATQCWTALFGAHLAGLADDGLRRRAGELVSRTLLGGIAAG